MGNHKLLNHTFCFKKCVDLFLILKAAVKKEDINILILGETGVGKSTWINGIANYAKHGSLQDAMDAPEFTVLIPSRYKQFSNLSCF
jgi:ribosome biogenesis GTPase A